MAIPNVFTITVRDSGWLSGEFIYQLAEQFSDSDDDCEVNREEALMAFENAIRPWSADLCEFRIEIDTEAGTARVLEAKGGD